MNDAAVGFQCDECVKAGRRETRSGLATYGGRRSANPQATSVVLIALNAAVWALIMATGGARSAWVERLALAPSGRCVDKAQADYWYPNANEAVCGVSLPTGRWVPGVADGAWWQLLTNMFTHVQVWHILLNMLALWFIGPMVESVVGRTRFLAIYLLSGLAGSTLVYWFAGTSGFTLGASGAIFGIMGAFLVLAHKLRRDVNQILLWVGLNFVITFTIPNISWQGHLGGFLGGVVITALIAYAPVSRRGVVQALGLVAMAALLAAALIARTLTLA